MRKARRRSNTSRASGLNGTAWGLVLPFRPFIRGAAMVCQPLFEIDLRPLHFERLGGPQSAGGHADPRVEGGSEQGVGRRASRASLSAAIANGASVRLIRG